MGFVDELSSLIRKGPEAAARMSALKMNTKSVARGAKDSTFQFPCLIVDSAPIDMASTIARTLDQVYASFTQTWLSMNNMFDITIDPTPLSYLKRIHQNMKLEGVDILATGEEDMDTFTEKIYSGEYRAYMTEDMTRGLLFNRADRVTSAVIESHKSQLDEYMSDFNLEPLDVMTEADSDHTSELDFANAMVAGHIAQKEDDLRDRNFERSRHSQAPKLLDRDVKRSNDMVPYAIQVRMIAVNDKREFVQYVDFVLGIKAILHPIESSNMIENLARALQNRSVSFKLLRWTTGEISLFKDIILNLSDMKADAVNKRDGKSPFFSTLKRLKNRRFKIQNATSPYFLVPNSTIVITSFEADELQKRFAINLRNSSVAKKLLNTLFLMAFIIMDEGTGTISVMYDGDDEFQTYALETLERDNSINSNKLGREIGRMISQ